MKKYVLEYSQSQDAYHIQSMEDALEKNRQMALSGKPNDYAIIGVFATREAAQSKYNGVINRKGETNAA